MDWTPFKPLLTKATAKLVALTMKTQQAAQPPELEKVVACLNDGSIDPGDFQQVSQGLLKIIVEMPEYQDIVNFTRESRQAYSELYRALGTASVEDYTAFLELNQKIAVEMMTEAMFGLLVAQEILVDKRSPN